jgi:hypothetical protein
MRCVIINGGWTESGPTTQCERDGSLPYYDGVVCEQDARAMLPEDVLPPETIAALAAADAKRITRAISECVVLRSAVRLKAELANMLAGLDAVVRAADAVAAIRLENFSDGERRGGSGTQAQR